ncbi:PSAP [Acanthosepion pharaonis]|uniref:PSAP n=1 Tax=Acanthosepion pharaonis TaxID=158019 RepID=A0A812B7G7_ACAPH|nr:PSAP [Sepia pharaonis]
MFSKVVLLSLLATLGCVLGNSILSRRSYSMLGTNHCTWGPSYWCGHISKAKECGTLKHCAAVWGQQPLNNPTEFCEMCEYFVSGVQKLHTRNLPQKRIGLYMETLCYQMSGKELMDKCLEDIAQYLTEVLQLLDLGLTHRAVCYAINLCPQQKSSPIAKTVVMTTTMKPDKICHDCQAFFNDVRQRLQSNVTVKNVENLFDNTICVSLGPLREICRQFIEAFVPVYLKDVSEFIDPGFFCSVLNFCPASQETTLFEALSQNSMNSAVKTTGDEQCSNCKIFIQNIKKEIDSDTSVDKVKDILEKDVCSHLGEYKPVCDIAVETYAKEILNDILNNVDSSMICRRLHLCNGYVMNALIVHLKSIKFSRSNPFQESTECELCKVLMSKLHSLIEDKNVQKAVVDFLDNEICVKLDNMKSACLTLVQEYGPLIMKAIQSLLEPNNSCNMLGMCSNSSESKTVAKSSITNTVPLSLLTPVAAFSTYQRVGLVLPSKTDKKTSESEQCKLCEMVMEELEKILKDTTIQEDIKKALDKVCSILPSSMSDQCTQFVNQYTDGIIDLILSQIKPKMVCTALDLCQSVSVPDLTSCSYCSEILGIASGHLAANPNLTKNDFEEMLLNLCYKYAEQYKDVCEPGVKQFGDTVYKALKNGIAPREVCGMISFCAASAIKPETRHYMGVMCELLKSAGVTTECKEFNEISKEINNHFLTVLLKKTASKETNALKPKSDINCPVCQNVVNYLQSLTIAKLSLEKLKHLLQISCSYLESRYLMQECDNLVQNYEDKLIPLLIQDLPSKKVCEAIGICSAKVWKKNN